MTEWMNVPLWDRKKCLAGPGHLPPLGVSQTSQWGIRIVLSLAEGQLCYYSLKVSFTWSCCFTEAWSKGKLYQVEKPASLVFIHRHTHINGPDYKKVPVGIPSSNLGYHTLGNIPSHLVLFPFNTRVIYMAHGNFWCSLSFLLLTAEMPWPTENDLFGFTQFELIWGLLRMVQQSHQALVTRCELWRPWGWALDHSYFIASLWCPPLGEAAITCLWAQEIRYLWFVNPIIWKDQGKSLGGYIDPPEKKQQHMSLLYSMLLFSISPRIRVLCYGT